jgi:predicted  nucleic acid-binding Zn-ribbon protein
MTKESLNDSLFELNTLILDLRSKLSKSLQEVLQLRKDLDLEKEEHQLTELKYQSMKDMLTDKLDNKINAARGAVKEVIDDGTKR